MLALLYNLFSRVIDAVIPPAFCRHCGTPVRECGVEGLYCERCLLHGRPSGRARCHCGGALARYDAWKEPRCICLACDRVYEPEELPRAAAPASRRGALEKSAGPCPSCGGSMYEHLDWIGLCHKCRDCDYFMRRDT